MSPITDVMLEPTWATSNKFGFCSGASATPITFEPRTWRYSDSHAPLKPVCPVKRTRLPFQKPEVITRLSTELYHDSTSLRDRVCRAGCPWDARSPHAD